jgi:tetratricopeptide (TPR) repeat protein
MKIIFNLLLLFFFLTLFNTASIGQTQQIDSLRGEIIKYSQSKMFSFSRDTNLVNTFLEIAKLFHRQNQDSSLHYSTQGLDLSKSIKWKLGESKSLYHLGFRSHILRDYETAIDFYNKSIEIVQNLYPETKGGSLAIRCYDLLAFSYGNLGKDLKAIECGQLMLEIAEKTKDLEMQINANNALGSGYRRLEKNIEALTYYKNGFEIAQKINNPV